MKLFYYGLVMSLGVLGMLLNNFSNYRTELIIGWLLPALSGIITMYFINMAFKISSIELTKTLMKGFLLKMIYYIFAIFLLHKIYSFKPIPFICSFSGFFIGLHILEAIIIKRFSEKFIVTQK